MFFPLLLILVLAGSVHAFGVRGSTPGRPGEVFLVWILGGYCGAAMVLVSLGILVAPDRMGELLPVGAADGHILRFFGWAYLGMSVTAFLSIPLRGPFLVGPAVTWAIYFAGATEVHIHHAPPPDSPGGPSHGEVLGILATHLLVSVLLAFGVAWRQWSRRRGHHEAS